jgi:hypothetical protein
VDFVAKGNINTVSPIRRISVYLTNDKSTVIRMSRIIMGPPMSKQKCWSEGDRPGTPLQRGLVILQPCQNEKRNEILCDCDSSKFEILQVSAYKF